MNYPILFNHNFIIETFNRLKPMDQSIKGLNKKTRIDNHLMAIQYRLTSHYPVPEDQNRLPTH